MFIYSDYQIWPFVYSFILLWTVLPILLDWIQKEIWKYNSPDIPFNYEIRFKIEFIGLLIKFDFISIIIFYVVISATTTKTSFYMPFLILLERIQFYSFNLHRSKYI